MISILWLDWFHFMVDCFFAFVNNWYMKHWLNQIRYNEAIRYIVGISFDNLVNLSKSSLASSTESTRKKRDRRIIISRLIEKVSTNRSLKILRLEDNTKLSVHKTILSDLALLKTESNFLISAILGYKFRGIIHSSSLLTPCP